MPHTLAGLKVDAERFDEMSAMAPEDPTAGGNPVPITKESARKLYEDALAGPALILGCEHDKARNTLRAVAILRVHAYGLFRPLRRDGPHLRFFKSPIASPTMPRRNSSTQTMKMMPVSIVTGNSDAAR